MFLIKKHVEHECIDIDLNENEHTNFACTGLARR